jgi:hypothetical protein
LYILRKLCALLGQRLKAVVYLGIDLVLLLIRIKKNVRQREQDPLLGERVNVDGSTMKKCQAKRTEPGQNPKSGVD